MTRPAVLATASILAIALVATAQVASPQPTAEGERKPGAHAAMRMSGDMTKDMRMMNKMMVAHLGEGDAQYDARWIDLMIPHHEGAVLMAKDALKKSRRPEIQAMAKKMIEDQQKEVKQLQQWRQAWYGNSPGAN